MTMGEINKGGEAKRLGEEVFSPAFGEDFESQSLRQNDHLDTASIQEDLNSSWEKAVSDIEARKRQLQQQQREMKGKRKELPIDDTGKGKNTDLDQFEAPVQIQHIGQGEQARPPILDSICVSKVNFGAIHE